tara:strand:- start:884 stop:1120 length:237 start_codon:yes stop_codon:yes gene_type:complete
MGVKKSTVWIKVFLFFKRNAAESSDDSKPKRTESSLDCFKFPSISDKSPGPILHAQPEPVLNVVNLISSLFISVLIAR